MAGSQRQKGKRDVVSTGFYGTYGYGYRAKMGNKLGAGLISIDEAH